MTNARNKHDRAFEVLHKQGKVGSKWHFFKEHGPLFCAGQ